MIMTTALLAALSVSLAPPVVPQTATAPAPQGEPMVAPLLDGATLAPTCGDLYDLAGRAFCVTAPLAAIGALADAYVAHFQGEGWIAAEGDDNRVVFVKRRDGGGCDGMQLQAFYDTTRPTAPQAPGFIGMATIPGNVCAASAPSSTPSVTPVP